MGGRHSTESGAAKKVSFTENGEVSIYERFVGGSSTVPSEGSASLGLGRRIELRPEQLVDNDHFEGNNGALFVPPHQRAMCLKNHMGQKEYFRELANVDQQLQIIKLHRLESSPPFDSDGIIEMSEFSHEAREQALVDQHLSEDIYREAFLDLEKQITAEDVSAAAAGTAFVAPEIAYARAAESAHSEVRETAFVVAESEILHTGDEEVIEERGDNPKKEKKELAKHEAASNGNEAVTNANEAVTESEKRDSRPVGNSNNRRSLDLRPARSAASRDHNSTTNCIDTPVHPGLGVRNRNSPRESSAVPNDYTSPAYGSLSPSHDGSDSSAHGIASSVHDDAVSSVHGGPSSVEDRSYLVTRNDGSPYSVQDGSGVVTRDEGSSYPVQDGSGLVIRNDGSASPAAGSASSPNCGIGVVSSISPEYNIFSPSGAANASPSQHVNASSITGRPHHASVGSSHDFQHARAALGSDAFSPDSGGPVHSGDSDIMDPEMLDSLIQKTPKITTKKGKLLPDSAERRNSKDTSRNCSREASKETSRDKDTGTEARALFASSENIDSPESIQLVATWNWREPHQRGHKHQWGEYQEEQQCGENQQDQEWSENEQQEQGWDANDHPWYKVAAEEAWEAGDEKTGPAPEVEAACFAEQQCDERDDDQRYGDRGDHQQYDEREASSEQQCDESGPAGESEYQQFETGDEAADDGLSPHSREERRIAEFLERADQDLEEDDASPQALDEDDASPQKDRPLEEKDASPEALEKGDLTPYKNLGEDGVRPEGQLHSRKVISAAKKRSSIDVMEEDFREEIMDNRYSSKRRRRP